jgi:hypothetical protein
MPRSPSHGIATGLKYGAAIWIGAAVIVGLLAGGIKIGHDESKRIVARHSENFSSFRIANGGQP